MLPTDNNFESEFTFETAAFPVPAEPPFYILLLGNWSGDSKKIALTDRRPIEIDRDNFDEVLKKLNVSLELDWQGDITEQLFLEFSELDDFHPDKLFKNVSLFSDLRDIRRRLSNPDTFNRAANEVRSWFPAIKNQTEDNQIHSQNNDLPPIETENLLDFILTNPTDSSVSMKPRVVDNSELGKFVSKILSPHIIQIDEHEQSNLISAVDDTVSELMRAILHHPKFQALESAWRGLYFLVRRVETDIDLKIYISDVSQSELTDNLKSVNSLVDSALFRQLTATAPEILADESFAVIGGNFSFGLNVDDVAALMRIGKISSMVNAPFLSHLKPEIFGIRDFSELSDVNHLMVQNDSNEEKLWNALRSAPESSFIGLSPMKFLARVPYGFSTDSLETFSFEEFAGINLHHHYLWTNPCFAVILLLAQSYRLSGWEMANSLRHELANLPLHNFHVQGITKTKPCAEIVLTESLLEKFLEQGLIPLISFRDTDKVRIARFQSISSSNTKLSARW